MLNQLQIGTIYKIIMLPKINKYLGSGPLLINRDEFDKQLLKVANDAGLKTYKEYLTHKMKPIERLEYINYNYGMPKL